MNISYGRSKIGKGTIIGNHVVIGYPLTKELVDGKSLKPEKLKSVKGAIIGKNCILRDFGIIYSQTKLGNEVKTGHHYLVREETVIGNDTYIGSNVVIKANCEIGNNVSLQSGIYLASYSVIKDDVFLGPNVVVSKNTYPGFEDPYRDKLKGVHLYEDVRVGANSTIMPGVRIGHNAVVSAGSVVTTDVLPNTLVAGIPAKTV